ncbi:MAG: hypothetical protein ACP5UA_04875 [Candidatus Hydrogenedens sp.]
MGIKYKRTGYIQSEVLHPITGPRLYKKRNIFFFLFVLCTALFLFSGLFLNQQNSEKKLIYTEGSVINKTIIVGQEHNLPGSDKIGCQLIVEFPMRNGRKVQKEISLEDEFCSHINTGDTLSILYHYNKWKGSVEIVSYSRMPLRQGNN